MMELKVTCDCGQKFSFDVEPVNWLMPYAVHCPNCRADGTDKANQILQQIASALPSAPAMSAAPMASSAPVVLPGAGLRINKTAHAAPAMAAPPAPVPRAYAAPAAAPAYAAAPASATSSGNFGLGVVGAIAGGVVGMLIWYFLAKATGMRLGFLAIGVGYLTGMGAKLLGRQHHTVMGLVAGVCALVCIIGTQYLRTKAELTSSDEEIEQSYNEEMAEAQKLLATAPNGTDQELRTLIAKEDSADGIPTKPEEIDEESIKEYRTDAWQPAKDLVSGKHSKADYIKEQRAMESEVYESPIGKIIFWIFALGIFNIVSVVIGTGVAYKIGIGEE